MVISSLSGAFHLFHSFKALVIGDFLLDTYTMGRVRRVSPEAPVQVLEVLDQESKAGGAGNAALNLIALGGSVSVMGRIGSDPEGELLKKTLLQSGADVRFLLVEKGYRTPVKNRLIADSQQLMRIDMETVVKATDEVEEMATAMLEEIIPFMQVIAISDYGKGFLTKKLIAASISIAKRANVSCIVDPKGTDFTKYRGADILKPNLSEAYKAAALPESASLDTVASQILKSVNIKQLLITRSEAGMSLFDRKGQRLDFPVRAREVKDVTGAGDTVLAMIGLGIANGIDISVCAQLANIAAGIAIEKLGCATICLSDVAERLLEIDCKNKIFHEHQMYVLQQVLKNKYYGLLVLDRAETMSGDLFQTICRLAKEYYLVLYIRGSDPEDEFVQILSTLHDIKAIILQKENLRQLCNIIHPHEVFFFKDRNMKKLDDHLLETAAFTIWAPPKQYSPS
ncbi:MAG TPA: bifunctional ADP-heptose synthase [Chlamydiales bacterium]|nr:bifunctional ADP-heptose synthase [Chlamydiales bacterium]